MLLLRLLILQNLLNFFSIIFMSLKDTIKNDVIVALKTGDKEKALTLRTLQAAIKDREIDLHKREEGLSDEEVIEVMMREVKKRRDAMEAFSQGGRKDLVDKEAKELALLEVYLPAQLAEDEIKKEVMLAIEETHVTRTADIGRIMKVLMPRLKGRADGNKVREIAQQMLQK